VRDALSAEIIAKLSAQEFISADEAHLKTTDKGRLLLNRITAELLQ